MATSLSAATAISDYIPESQPKTPKNRFQYLYFDVTSGFFDAVMANTCDCAAIAAKILIFALPIIFILEALFDLVAFPLFWIANQICHETDESDLAVKLTPPIFPMPSSPLSSSVSSSAPIPALPAPPSTPPVIAASISPAAASSVGLPSAATTASPADAAVLPLPDQQRSSPPTYYERFRAAIGLPLPVANPPVEIPAAEPIIAAEEPEPIVLAAPVVQEEPTPATAESQYTILRFLNNYVVQSKPVQNTWWGVKTLYTSLTAPTVKEEDE